MKTFIVLCLLAFGKANEAESENVAMEYVSAEQEWANEMNSSLKNTLIRTILDIESKYTSIPEDYLPSKASEYSTNNYIIKDFYNFGVNDEDIYGSTKATPVESQQPKQKLRIIFIRTPEQNDITNQVLTLNKGTQSQKEIIYVLKKQLDLKDLMEKYKNLKTPVDHKTKVYFLNYHKERDVKKAQNKILQYYDSLGATLQGKFSGTVKPLKQLLQNDEESSSSSSSSSFSSSSSSSYSSSESLQMDQ